MKSAHKPHKKRANKDINTETKHNRFKKIAKITGISVLILLVVWLGSFYAVARWYQQTQKGIPISMGVSYSFKLAREYGFDPKEGYHALIEDMGVRRFRLMSYWDDIESTKGIYNFNDLDYQFAEAEKYGAKISLAIGLRQPRWPECHWPQWAQGLSYEIWKEELFKFIEIVIARYKNSPALVEYQLENEFFMKVFGICPDHSRERLVEEYNLVKKLDPTRPIIVSRSNNGVGIAIGEPRPDSSAISVYKRVWDKTVTKNYFEYPFPAWHYGYLAGFTKIFTGRNMIIHELQAEPWGPVENKKLTFEEQNKSMDAERLRARIGYGLASGMRTVDLWGAEWWYWRKVHWQDNTVWDTAKNSFERCDGKTIWLDHCMKEN